MRLFVDGSRMAGLPSSFYCGDSLEFTDEVEAGSTGNAVFRHVDSGDVYSVELVVSSTTATATVDPTKTINAKPGIYNVAFVLKNADGERVTQPVGKVKLLSPVDRPARESHARKMVQMLEAHLEGRISDSDGRGLESYTIAGVPISKLSFMDARSLLTKYRQELDEETTKARAEAGLGTGRRILISFE